jgi:hypothetical protein
LMIRVSGTVPVRYDTATTVQYRIRDQGERFYSSSFFLVSVQTFFSTCNIHFFWLIVICDRQFSVFSDTGQSRALYEQDPSPPP